MFKPGASWKVAAAWLVVCPVPGHQLRAQDVESILARYYQAMGGLERLRAWRGIYAEGRYVLVSQGGTAVPVRAWYRAPDKKRYEMSPEGRSTAVYAFDGEHAWFCDPSNGVTEPTLMPEEQARQTRVNADEYPFIDYAAKGHRVELVGTEEVRGRQMFRIKLTRNNGAESFHLFDGQTGREVRIILTVGQGGREVPYETVLTDFRTVGGLELPFVAESWIDERLVRRMEMDRVDIDPPLPDSFFLFAGRCQDGGS